MGYAHSWGTHPALRTVVATHRKVPRLDHATLSLIDRILLHFAADISGIILRDDLIRFQPGPDPDQSPGECFLWKWHDYGIDGSGCKTDRGEFDTAVCLILIVLRQFYGGLFVFSSNGNVSDWASALNLANTFDISVDATALTHYLREESDMLRWMYPN